MKELSRSLIAAVRPIRTNPPRANMDKVLCSHQNYSISRFKGIVIRVSLEVAEFFEVGTVFPEFFIAPQSRVIASRTFRNLSEPSARIPPLHESNTTPFVSVHFLVILRVCFISFIPT